MTERMTEPAAGGPAASTDSGPGGRPRQEPRRWIWFSTGGVLIALFLVYGATTFRESLTPYVSIREAATAGRRVQVVGQLVPGSTELVESTQQLRFGLRDDEGSRLEVLYGGIKPGNFEEAKEIVVIGSYREGAFHAEQVLVKCPSKYQGLGDEHPDSVPMSDGAAQRTT
jgi:cytochrome c-type biogenesis protein CcmE